MELRNGRTSLVFDEKTGGIVRLSDARTGRILINAAEPGRSDGRLFRLILPTPQWQSRYLDSHWSGPPTIEQSAQRVTLAWSSLANPYGVLPVSARVVIDLPEGRDEVLFTLKIENRSDGDITDVAFPQLGGWTGFGGPGKDKITYGGSATLDPHQFPANRGMTYVRCHQRQAIFSIYTYCPWIDLSGPEGGISYIGYLDRPRNFTFSFENLAGYDPGLRLCYGFGYYTWIKPGQSWQSSPVGIGVHGGDWRETADRFNDWVQTWYTPCQTPAWAKQSIGFQNVFCRGFEGTPIRPLESIPEVARVGRKYGVDHLCLWDAHTLGNYSRIGDPDILDFPPHEKDTLRRALAQLKQEKFQTSALICWSYVNPTSSLFKKYGQTEAARRWDGSFRTTEFVCSYFGPSPQPFHLGPGAHYWDFRGPNFRNRVKSQLREYLDLGFTSLFYDSSFALESYTPGLGDGQPDGNHTAAVELDREVREIIRELSPEGILIGEQGDYFSSQYVDAWMEWYRDFQMAVRARYSLPWAMRCWVVDDKVADAARAFAAGLHLCLTPRGSEGTMDDVPEVSRLVAQMAKLRTAAGPRYYDAVFRHTRGLAIESDETFMAYAFNSAQGPAVAVAAPGQKGSGQVVIDRSAFAQGTGETSRIIRLDGTVERTASSDRHHFKLGSNEVAVWLP